MTNSKRVILTNKETGQALPEATLLNKGTWYVVRFDGATMQNSFERDKWDITYVEPPVTYRKGDVLRRKDRDPDRYFAIYTGEKWIWVDILGHVHDVTYQDIQPYLQSDNWELV